MNAERTRARRGEAPTPPVLSLLQGEHLYMSELLSVVDEAAGRPDLAAARTRYLLQDILHYMSSYPDAVHHPIENHLFRRLSERDARSASLVDKQLQEHVFIERESQALARMIEELDAADADDRQQALRRKIRRYAQRLREHMRREEEQLFPRAARMLAAEDWGDIEAQLQEAEDPLHGGRVSDRFRLLYEFLAARADEVGGGAGRFGVAGFDLLVESVDAFDEAAVQARIALRECLTRSATHWREAALQALGGEGFTGRLLAPLELGGKLLLTFAGTGWGLTAISAQAARSVAGSCAAAFGLAGERGID